MIDKRKRQITSQIGSLQIEAHDTFITSIKFIDENQGIIPDNDSNSEVLDKCMHELKEYFEGSRKSFTVSFIPSGTDFEKEVWMELVKIPFGQTISYEQLAIRLGDINKIRAAARANGKNPIPILIPCHRVIGKDGSLVGFSGGLHRKEWLLSHEGAIGRQSSIF